jgi:hypothetical protein
VDTENPDTSQYLLFMVSEKEASRSISIENFQTIMSDAILSWLSQEVTKHTIKINYDFDDPENQAWINWQLSRMTTSSSKTTTTTQGITTVTTAVTTEPAVDYSFRIYLDEGKTSAVDNRSPIDVGSIAKGTMTSIKLYLENTGDEVDEQVIVNSIHISDNIMVGYTPVTLGPNGSLSVLELAVAVASGMTTGDYSFELMFSRGTDTRGYTLVVPVKLSVTGS